MAEDRESPSFRRIPNYLLGILAGDIQSHGFPDSNRVDLLFFLVLCFSKGAKPGRPNLETVPGGMLRYSSRYGTGSQVLGLSFGRKPKLAVNSGAGFCIPGHPIKRLNSLVFNPHLSFSLIDFSFCSKNKFQISLLITSLI